MRDSKGRFVRKRDYRLVFDDGHNEDIRAYTPSQAVACRAGGRASMLPHTITDLTAIHEWADIRVLVLDRPQPTPLLDRMRTAIPPSQTVTDYWLEAWDD